MNKVQPAHKPSGGLIAVLVALLLAAACGAGLLAIGWYDGRPMRNQEKRDEARFLSLIDKLTPYLSYMKDYIKGANLIEDIWNNPNTETLTRSDVMLVSPDGEVLDRNIDSSLSTSVHEPCIRWRDGYAWLTYADMPSMEYKFKVTVYDADHWSGGAAAQGSFGRSSDGSAQADSALLFRSDPEVSGRMMIFIARDNDGNTLYLVDAILPNGSTGGGYGVPGMPGEASAGASSWLKAGKDILRPAFPPLLALYWLLLPYWGYLDARRRGMRADVWAPVLLVFNAAGLAVYLLIARAKQRREAVTACAACGGRALRAFPHCPWCGAALRRTCPACSAELQRDWAVCPHCDGKPRASAAEPAADEMPESLPEAVVLEAPPPPTGEGEDTPAIPAMFRDDWQESHRNTL